MFVFLLIFLLGVHLSAAQTASCPDGYDSSPFDICYKAYLTPMDFDSALVICTSVGIDYHGYLASVPHAFLRYPFDGDNYAIAQKVSNGKWESSRMDLAKPFLCEYYLYLPTLPPPVQPTFMSCPANWTYFNVTEKCYYVATKYGYEYNDAYEDCTSIDGQLVSIHSQEENDFVTNLVYTIHPNTTNVPWFMWIGLHYDIDDSTYHWEDGSPLDYTNWYRNATVKLPTGNECAAIRTIPNGKQIGSWIDTECLGRLTSGYVCELEMS